MIKLTLLPIDLLSDMEDSTDEITIKEEPIIWDDVADKQEDGLRVNLNDIKSEELDEEILSIGSLKQSNDIKQVNSITKLTLLPTELLSYIEDLTEEITIKEEPIIWDNVAVKQEDNLSVNLNNVISEELDKKSLSIGPLKQSNDIKQFWIKTQSVDNVKCYSCCLCEYKTNRRESIRRHSRTHFRKRNWCYCDTCGYKASEKYSLIVHIKTHHLVKHESVEKLQCNLCNFVSFEEDELREHARQHLRDYTMVQCEICNGVFKKVHIKQHVEGHTDEKINYLCRLCKYTCRRKCDMKSHMKMHNMKNHLTCETCGYKTSRGYCMKKHILTHSMTTSST